MGKLLSGKSFPFALLSCAGKKWELKKPTVSVNLCKVVSNFLLFCKFDFFIVGYSGRIPDHSIIEWFRLALLKVI